MDSGEAASRDQAASQEWIQVCKRQRAAYMAWQAAADAWSGPSFLEYLKCSDAMKKCAERQAVTQISAGG